MPTVNYDEQQKIVIDDIVDDNNDSNYTDPPQTPLWAHYRHSSRFRQSAYNPDDIHADTLVAISYVEYAIKHHNSTHKTLLTNEDISNILHWYFILNNFTNSVSKKRIENYFSDYYE